MLFVVVLVVIGLMILLVFASREQSVPKTTTREVMMEQEIEKPVQSKANHIPALPVVAFNTSLLDDRNLLELKPEKKIKDTNEVKWTEPEAGLISDASLVAIDRMEKLRGIKSEWKRQEKPVTIPVDLSKPEVADSIIDKAVMNVETASIPVSLDEIETEINDDIKKSDASKIKTNEEVEAVLVPMNKMTETEEAVKGFDQNKLTTLDSLISKDEVENLAGIMADSQDVSIIDVSGDDVNIDYVSIGKNEAENTKAVPPAATQVSTYDSYAFDDNRLGKRFGEKLGLSEEEMRWCNSFWDYQNVFTAVKGCALETVRLFVAVINELKKKLAAENTSFEKEESFFVNKISEDLKSKYGNYFFNDNSYLGGLAKTEFFSPIFKRVENKVRDAYDHKRKVNDDFPRPSLMPEYENRIGRHINAILTAGNIEINPPTATTEISLNQMNTSRWKKSFDNLEENLTVKNLPKFVKGVEKLGRLNEKNPSIENIFFEASKATAKIDKVESLKFYVRYIHYDLISEEINNKQHNKTIQKSLFKTREQLDNFTTLLSDFTKTKDLEKALTEVPLIYVPKRRKIELNQNLIHRVEEQDSQTVELLNEYLEDDTDNSGSSTEIPISIPLSETGNSTVPALEESVFITAIQKDFIGLFSTNNLSLSADQVGLFCKERGLMQSAFIESINEACYDSVDDLLIEDAGDGFTITQNYYDKILKK